jgi:hypothetical protein
MPFSGMLSRVALVGTNFLKEGIAYIIRVTRIGELGTVAVTSNRSALLCMSSEHSSASSYC